MITYNNNRFFLILFKKIIPYHLIEVFRNACISTLFVSFVAILNEETGLDITITDPWNNTLSVFNFFLGLFISFRLNSSFGSWSTGVSKISDLENTSTKLMNTMYASLITDAFQEDRQQRLDFIWEFKQNIILYIANIFQNCRGDNGRHDNLRENYLTDQQVLTKNSINSLVKKSKDIDMEIVETCMHTRFYTRTLELELKKLIGIAGRKFQLHPSVSGGMNAKIDMLAEINNTLYGMSNIPVVFIYNQFINFVIIIYLVLYSLMTIPSSGYWSGFWVFIWSFVVFLANSISNEIDSPFGTDNNDIELEIILLNIKDEYRAMFEYVSNSKISSPVASITF